MDGHQFHHACGGNGPRWVRQCDACLMMTHHPPGWLTGQARKKFDSEIAPPGRFAAHLFGHATTSKVDLSGQGGLVPRPRVQSGPLFGRGGPNRQARRYGYVAGTIELGRSVLRLWPRIAVLRPRGHLRFVADLSGELERDEGTLACNIKRRRQAQGASVTEAPDDGMKEK